MKIGIIGSGAMGTGIAQVALFAGEEVFIYDTSTASLEKSKQTLVAQIQRAIEKGKIEAQAESGLQANMHFASTLEEMGQCDWVIEAIVENLDVKKSVFAQLDTLMPNALLCSNTSSLSLTAIASACKNPSRVWGIHFFNPAAIMPLVEIIPALQTNQAPLEDVVATIKRWGKVPVVTKDLPGFIVNRLARPFYSEALRIYDEGLATFQEIDEAMKALGFKMGPFELMDLIGNDVNYAVTESVFAANYFDPRYKPSTTQKRHVEAGWFGKKTNRGYYDYQEGATHAQSPIQKLSKEAIGTRILSMLINEAYEALRTGLASAEDLDLAMTKGVNYPKGLIAWGKDIGLNTIKTEIENLYHQYGEDRYRLSLTLKEV